MKNGLHYWSFQWSYGDFGGALSLNAGENADLPSKKVPITKAGQHFFLIIMEKKEIEQNYCDSFAGQMD